MPEGCLLMSAAERERSHLVRRSIEKSLSQREAAERLGCGGSAVQTPGPCLEAAG